MTKIINFISGPCSGKTTLATQLFGVLKERGLNVVYVPEYATEMVWKDRSLDDQIYITAKHHNNIYDLIGKVDYIVSDTSIFLGIYYIENSLKKYKDIDTLDYNNIIWSFKALIMYLFNIQDNMVFFVERGNKKFTQKGRVHTEEESKEIDVKLKNMLDSYMISYYTVSNLSDILKEFND